MALNPDSFSDLATRLATGVVIAGVGLTAIWAGGWWFTALATLVCGLLIWELVRMLDGNPPHALILGLAAGAAMIATKLLPVGLGLPLVMLVAIAGIALLDRNKLLYALMSVFVLLASFGLIQHRDEFGLTWMLWLVLLVVITDIFGYFAGRIIGGPKFWPAISPKKTWAGTVAGWIGAALVGVAFMKSTGSGVELVGISVALSMASQMGDVAESAIKRRVGVKDSSNLLPGHGGVFDRFDALLGAALVLLIVEAVADFPPAPL